MAPTWWELEILLYFWFGSDLFFSGSTVCENDTVSKNQNTFACREFTLSLMASYWVCYSIDSPQAINCNYLIVINKGD